MLLLLLEPLKVRGRCDNSALLAPADETNQDLKSRAMKLGPFDNFLPSFFFFFFFFLFFLFFLFFFFSQY